jgi:hypothetical protein
MEDYEIYELLFEALQMKVDEGELTIEDAEIVNDLAYDKWVTEGAYKKYMTTVAKDKLKKHEEEDNTYRKLKQKNGDRCKSTKIELKRVGNDARFKHELNKRGITDDDLKEYDNRQKRAKEKASIEKLYSDLEDSKRQAKQTHPIRGRLKNVATDAVAAPCKVVLNNEIRKGETAIQQQQHAKRKFKEYTQGKSGSHYNYSGTAPELPEKD